MVGISKLKRRELFVLLGLITASLACRLPGQQTQPQVYSDPIPVTTQAATELAANVEEAQQQFVQSGFLDIRLTEAQLTSAATLAIARENPGMLSALQIYLREGQVQLTAQTVQGGVTLPVVVTLLLSVTPEGKPAYEVTNATLGPLPVPESLLDQLKQQIDQSFSDTIHASGKEIHFEKIEIADGVLHITGTTR